MTITHDGWFNWAERAPGPPDKVYSVTNTISGVIPHSMVGFYPAWYRRLMSQQRLSNGRYTKYSAASMTGSVLYDGRLIQHYPVSSSVWGSGSYYPNAHFNPYEFEGGPPGNVHEPFNLEQTTTLIRIIEDTSAYGRWTPTRPRTALDKMASLYEHTECTRWDSRPTACPSGRVPWSYVLNKLQEDDMAGATAEEVLVANLFIALAKQALAGVPVSPAQQAQLCWLADCKGEEEWS